MSTHINPELPIKVKEKLLERNVNIGAEGTLSVYRCSPLTEPDVDLMFAVFIARFEGTANFKALTFMPSSEEKCAAAIEELLKSLSYMYVQDSMAERNGHTKLQ